MGLILFVLIAIVAEIISWIVVGDLVGSGWYVFFWFILAFVIGLQLLRSSTSHIMPQMQQMQMSGQMSSDAQSSKYLVRAIAAILLMVPGLLSDLVALLMLIPFVQNIFKKAAITALQKRQHSMMNQMMGGLGANVGEGQNPLADLMRQMQEMQSGAGNSAARNDATIIDGEAREVAPELKKIEHNQNKNS